MLIGELVKKTGLSRDTIRFYEKLGLISVGRKERRVNNYKEYSEDALRRLTAIKLIKGFGFTLNEASDLLDMIDVNQATCSTVSLKVEEKIKTLEEKIRELMRVRTILLEGVEKCSGGCNPLNMGDNCPMLYPSE